MRPCQLVAWMLLGIGVVALAVALTGWALFPGWRRTPGGGVGSAPLDVARVLLACVHTVENVRRAVRV